MDISFLLNGETVTASVDTGTETLLDFIRETRGLKGTKEGCNEGDCGACSVIVTDHCGTPRAVNACIMLLPQIQGKAVRTVEGVTGPDGTPHPIQHAMIEHHGSQCGFCTPGFVTTLAAAHANAETDFDTALAGNLCRCTGYAPIVKAAKAAATQPVPAWIADEIATASLSSTDDIYCPQSTDDLASWYAAHPDATLIAGATDVGLWVTKSLADLAPVAFLSHAKDLSDITDHGTFWRLGAGCTIRAVMAQIADEYPSLHAMFTRYGSPQVRNSATIGGNIANGSPIGDSPPALIALGATLHLRKGDSARSLPLEDFFVAYGKQDRQPGEFVTAVDIPKGSKSLRCYKLSKRFDQDISAVCGCFNITIEKDVVTNARIAFGGMAGTPKRATHVENALIGGGWSKDAVQNAALEMPNDFAPMTDQRAGAAYRMDMAQNMLVRYFFDLSHQSTNVLGVSP